ncbi:MAG: helix-turn-helix transcriptional regulator [Kiritimatiellae bacterium]|nr:helix-turn-helix transcriptional regulator [Kiritimatiellia bacterium]
MSVFGDNLKAARLAKGMTLVQSANALGITNPALSQWEQGKREPKFDMLLELCQLFDTSPNELLGFEPPAPSAPPRETKIRTGDNSPVTIVKGDHNKISQTINQPSKRRIRK